MIHYMKSMIPWLILFPYVALCYQIVAVETRYTLLNVGHA